MYSVAFEAVRDVPAISFSIKGVLLVSDLKVLLKHLRPAFGRPEVREGLSREVEAHKEDKGRKIATRVRTLESMEGRLTVYSRIEKIARGNG